MKQPNDKLNGKQLQQPITQKNDFTGKSNATQPKSCWTGTAGENDGSTKNEKNDVIFH